MKNNFFNANPPAPPPYPTRPNRNSDLQNFNSKLEIDCVFYDYEEKKHPQIVQSKINASLP